MRKLFAPIVLIVSLAAVCCERQAFAQVIVQRSRDDVPAVSRLLPVAIQRGQSVEVTISGERLTELTEVQGLPGTRLAGVVAAEEKQVRVTLEVAADAPPGIYPCCFLGKAGLSNPKLMRIDAWPQATEQEDNNRPADANRVTLPVGINGVLSQADQDCYRFTATAGQQVVFDVEAQRLGSALRPALTLFDAAGRELDSCIVAPRDIAPDSRLVYTFGSSGEYVVRLRDLTYAGADFGVYHLRMGPVAFATSMFPLGGQAGGKVAVTFTGGTLPAPLVHEIDLAGPLFSTLTARQLRLRVPHGDDQIVAPAMFAVGDLPEAVEQEPNSGAAEAQPVAWPITVNGQINAPGDRDVYRLTATAGAKLSLRLIAQELGSPLDALVTISDSSGKELLTIDDRQPVPREPPIVRSLSTPLVDDPLADFVFPAAGDYLVTVEDVFGAGGPEYGYRLELATGSPDFDLFVQPSVTVAARAGQPNQQAGQVQASYSGIGSGSLSIDRGGTAALVVRAFRRGYDGPIQLAVEGLPADVQASAAVIGQGQNETTISLTAAFEAAPAAGELRVIGTAALDGASAAAPTALKRLAVQPVVWTALPVNGAVERLLPSLAWGVSRQGAELGLQASLGQTLVPGGKSTLRIAAKRREGLAGDIAWQLINAPTGIMAAAGKIAAGENEAQLELVSDASLTTGRHSFMVEGSMAVPDRKEPVVAVFTLEFEVLPLVTLELAAQQLDVPSGGTATLVLRVRRNGGSAAPVELTLANLPRGVTAEATTIAGDAQQFELKLQGGTAQASPVRRIVQIRAKTSSGEQTVELPTLRFALRVTK